MVKRRLSSLLKTGLLGFPTKTENGVEFVSLLNNKIRPGRAVKLESKQFQGLRGQDQNTNQVASQALEGSGAIVKVKKATFEGDTHEGSWKVTVEATIPPGGIREPTTGQGL